MFFGCVVYWISGLHSHTKNPIRFVLVLSNGSKVPLFEIDTRMYFCGSSKVAGEVCACRI